MLTMTDGHLISQNLSLKLKRAMSGANLSPIHHLSTFRLMLTTTINGTSLLSLMWQKDKPMDDLTFMATLDSVSIVTSVLGSKSTNVVNSMVGQASMMSTFLSTAQDSSSICHVSSELMCNRALYWLSSWTTVCNQQRDTLASSVFRVMEVAFQAALSL